MSISHQIFKEILKNFKEEMISEAIIEYLEDLWINDENALTNDKLLSIIEKKEGI